MGRPNQTYRTRTTISVDDPMYSKVEYMFPVYVTAGGQRRLVIAEGIKFADGTYVERWYWQQLTLVYKDDEDTGFGAGPRHGVTEIYNVKTIPGIEYE